VTFRNATEGAIYALCTKNFSYQRTSPTEDIPDGFQYLTRGLITTFWIRRDQLSSSALAGEAKYRVIFC